MPSGPNVTMRSGSTSAMRPAMAAVPSRRSQPPSSYPSRWSSSTSSVARLLRSSACRCAASRAGGHVSGRSCRARRGSPSRPRRDRPAGGTRPSGRPTCRPRRRGAPRRRAGCGGSCDWISCDRTVRTRPSRPLPALPTPGEGRRKVTERPSSVMTTTTTCSDVGSVPIDAPSAAAQRRDGDDAVARRVRPVRSRHRLRRGRPRRRRWRGGRAAG